MSRPRPRATECVHGHPYTPENTWLDGLGKQRCRECMRLYEAERPPRDYSSRKTATCSECLKPCYPSWTRTPDGQRVAVESQTCAECRGWTRRAA